MDGTKTKGAYNRGHSGESKWKSRTLTRKPHATLVEHGQLLFRAPKQLIKFTGHPAADALLNDLATNPHAFVLGSVMDQTIKAERAWLIPFLIAEKLRGFSMDTLCQQSLADVNRLMSQPEPLHRYVDKMSEYFYSAVQRISTQYAGDAAHIWMGNPSSAEVVYRFLEFDGVGPKIANMAANILAREFKIPFADFFSIDISADVHVRRVFARLGLCAPDAAIEQVIYKARALHPVFPGMMDLPCWDIGRNWCKARGPECSACYMKDLCPTANEKKRTFDDNLHQRRRDAHRAQIFRSGDWSTEDGAVLRSVP